MSTKNRNQRGSPCLDRRPAPLGARADRISDELKDVLADLEPDRITGEGAIELFKKFGEIQRLSETASARVAARIEASGAWKDSAEGSCASYLASLDGGTRGQARSTLEVGKALAEFPLLQERARNGSLSHPKLVELATALQSEPDAERSLVAAAEAEPLWSTKERCQRVRATSARRDPLAATRRIRAGRHFTWWSDAEGAFCFQGRDTADRGALIRDRIESLARDLRSQRSRSPETGDAPRETDGALRADALFLLIGPVRNGQADKADTNRPDRKRTSSNSSRGRDHDRVQSSSNAGTASFASTQDAVINRPPRCNVMVRVDLDALLRGRTHPGECCEIDGQGPIPVPMARDLANDSVLRIVFHQAGDIRAVSTIGRTVKRNLRIALAARDRCCVVPGCGARSGLEIDHVVPFSAGGPTELDNLALLCHHHHFLKTFDGWTLSRTDASGSQQPGWCFEPPPEFGKEPNLGLDRPDGRPPKTQRSSQTSAAGA